MKNKDKTCKLKSIVNLTEFWYLQTFFIALLDAIP